MIFEEVLGLYISGNPLLKYADTLEEISNYDFTDKTHLKEDIDSRRTETLLIIFLHAAIYELLYRPHTSVNIIINEYLNVSKLFLGDSQKRYLNAMLDKISRKIRS